MEIKEILKITIGKSSFEYRTTLRNQRKFNIGDLVFFSRNTYCHEIWCGRIVGVLLEPGMNPSYLYTIGVPEGIASDGCNGVVDRVTCATMFLTLEEARKSALDACEARFKAQRIFIEEYFNQWNKNDVGNFAKGEK
jgi:hypothetical protein